LLNDNQKYGVNYWMRWKLFIFNTKSIYQLSKENEKHLKNENYLKEIREIKNIFYNGLFANVLLQKDENVFISKGIQVFRSYKLKQ